jgi:serine/threonine-protein kinase ULK/ATG1
MHFELSHLTGTCYCLQYNAGLFQESLSVELVVLALWNKALQICSSWTGSTAEGELPASASSSTNEPIPSSEAAGLSPNTENLTDFSSPSSVSLWAKQGFIAAFDRAEKASEHVRHMDG